MQINPNWLIYYYAYATPVIAMWRVKTLDDIDIHVLPDNAHCRASDGYVSPTELDECPTGCEICYPEGCINYTEE